MRAIALVHENLARSGELKENKDFETLGTLVLALERIAAMDLRQSASHAAGVEIQPPARRVAYRDRVFAARWRSLRSGGEIEEDLPPVWADRQSLMQVFLNLTKNSERAMEDKERKETDRERPARSIGSGDSLPRYRWRGCPPGAALPSLPGRAQSTGLGLYLSRAFMRSFKGDVHYEPEIGGSTFVVELSPALRESKNDSYEQRDSILLIDDHSLFRESLSRLLQTESDFHIVGTCASATEALRAAAPGGCRRCSARLRSWPGTGHAFLIGREVAASPATF